MTFLLSTPCLRKLPIISYPTWAHEIICQLVHLSWPSWTTNSSLWHHNNHQRFERSLSCHANAHVCHPYQCTQCACTYMYNKVMPLLNYTTTKLTAVALQNSEMSHKPFGQLSMIIHAKNCHDVAEFTSSFLQLQISQFSCCMARGQKPEVCTELVTGCKILQEQGFQENTTAKQTPCENETYLTISLCIIKAKSNKQPLIDSNLIDSNLINLK